MTTRPARIVVIGGGLAGITAALALSRAGRAVVLLERRPFLGGRAFSFRDPDAGAVVDNGQHVLVGACSRLRALLAAIGAPPNAFVRQPQLAITILDGEGRRAELRAARWPAPLHLAAALLGYRHLGARARVSVGRAVRALVATRGAARAALEHLPLGEWLERRGTPARARDAFWDPLVRPALNVAAAGANLPLSAFFLERALWQGPAAGALWLPAVGLSDAIGGPAGRALADAGIDVRTGARAEAIVVDGGRPVAVAVAAGGAIEADAVVAAVPPRVLDALLPGELRPDPPYAAVGSSPIVNVYLWYDRDVMDLPFAGTFGSPLQWVFDRARLLGRDAAGGPCIGVSLSAADTEIDIAKDELAERCDEALARAFPGRRGARRTRVAVVKEPHATFRAAPGVGPLRPPATGPVPGLWLAGDWTDTGWPATMEGAVRSGETAAAALLASSAMSGRL